MVYISIYENVKPEEVWKVTEVDLMLQCATYKTLPDGEEKHCEILDLGYIHNQYHVCDPKKSSWQVLNKIKNCGEPKPVVRTCYFQSINREGKLTNGIEAFHYILINPIFSSYSWCFNNRFFRRKSYIIFCDSKKGMENFLDRYLNFSPASYSMAKSIKEEFMKNWEDGRMFVCRW